MATIHIPEAEAKRNFSAIMAHVRSGEDVAIEENGETIALVTRPTKLPGRMLSEIISRAEARGPAAIPDEIFANDLRAAVESHHEMLSSPPLRTIEECIAMLPEDSTATIDEDFARDVAAAIAAHREPLDPTPWD
jgi:antitoxin (DNA-binding transcriptional repressor) of toxin-antitoxin stability system